MSTYSDPELIQLFQKRTPLIDVRSPMEFAEGSIPFSVNLPLMEDAERVAVGICYKEKGQAAAIELGHSLVHAEVKASRVKAWCEYIKKNPTAQVFCFRGGLRSQISCQWIREAGIERHALAGGYKRLRRFFLSWLDEAPAPRMLRLSGLTGSGKTTVLKKLNHHLDLEAMASHRGSAFGARGVQPGQISFENQLALGLMNYANSAFLVEDESAMIGKLTVPRRFFQQLRQTPMVVLRCSLEERLKNIFDDYVREARDEQLLGPLQKIERGLGGLRYQQVLASLKQALARGREFNDHEVWISMLLEWYYDPIYQRDLARNRELIAFEGTEIEVLNFIKSYPLFNKTY